MTKQAAERRIRWARNVCLLGAAMTLYGYFNTPPGYNPKVLLNTAIFVTCLSVGVHLKMRSATLLLLGFFLVNKYLEWKPVLAHPDGFRQNWYHVFIPLIVAAVYFEGVRGAFAWHRLEEQETPPTPARQ